MEIDAPLPQSIIKENNAPATTKTGRVFLEALLADHVTRFAFQQVESLTLLLVFNLADAPLVERRFGKRSLFAHAGWLSR